MNELLALVAQLMDYIDSNAGTINIETQRELASFLQETWQFIEEQQPSEQQSAPPPPPPPSQTVPSFQPPSNDAQLLWILAGQQEQAFISYLRSFPTPSTTAILANPQLLSQTLQNLNAMMPPGQPPTIGGIQHADLNSSNVWGAAYDQRTGKMKVRFQGGSIYEYDGVPENIFKAFIKGNASARTQGRNNYGVWWRGKNPSLGAALNQYIKAGNFPYHRIH